MKFRRWLFGAWMLASILWMATYFWHVGFDCFFYGATPRCEYWGDARALLNVYGHLAITFGIPVGTLGIGAAILWVIRRLQRDPSSN